MEADGKEQAEGDDHPGQGGDAGPQPDQDPEPDGHLADGDDQTERRGDVQQMSQQAVERARPLGSEQLGIDRGGAVVVEELGIGQLLEPGK